MKKRINLDNMRFELSPYDGGGLNLWCIASARRCRNANLSTHEAESRIMAFQGTAHRPIKLNEVRRAISKAYETELAPSTAPKPKKEQWQPRKTKTGTTKPQMQKVDHYHLMEASPMKIDDGLTAEVVLSYLFPDPDGLLCFGKSAFLFKTTQPRNVKDLTACQFIVPCYMTKKKGLTQDGKESEHCLDNCGDREYCVCDFDEPASEEHASIIWYLAKFYKLVMVLSSGGKSLHSWFKVSKEDEADFWKLAIRMGADPAMMRNRSSFVRMPFGTRDNGKTQQVYYFNPLDQSHPYLRP